jgi:hypothetical protein
MPLGTSQYGVGREGSAAVVVGADAVVEAAGSVVAVVVAGAVVAVAVVSTAVMAGLLGLVVDLSPHETAATPMMTTSATLRNAA